jgi:16S rRNA (cytosine967-C5)-methyltransferase
MKKDDKINVREVALRILFEIELKGSYADESIDRYSTELNFSSRDRRFLSQLVNGTIKLKKRIDYILNSNLNQKVEDLTPWIRNILRMGIYQIDYLSKVPHPAAVDESVKLAQKFGHVGTKNLVNAVLRNYLRKKEKVKFPQKDQISNFAVYYSFPKWMIKRWFKDYGEAKTRSLCEIFNSSPKLSLRLNCLKADSKNLEEELKRSKIKYKKGFFLNDFYYIESKLNLGDFIPLKNGWIYIQDESAAFPVLLLDPKPKQAIIDLCAAPGGKATFIAEKMKNTGQIVALDINEEKRRLIQENCLRLGIKNLITAVGDARSFSFRPVDGVLVDAPCTGLGVLAKNSDLRWHRKEEDVKRMKSLQISILLNAANLVKKGGVLVYSTCTMTQEENDEVVEEFLKQRDDFKLKHASKYVTREVVDVKGMVRTFPQKHHVDGSFAVRLDRIKSK